MSINFNPNEFEERSRLGAQNIIVLRFGNMNILELERTF